MRLVLLTLILSLIGTVASAQQAVTGTSEAVERVFDAVQKQVIEDFFRGRSDREDAATGDDDDDDDVGRPGDKKKKKKKRGGMGERSDGDLPPGLAKRDGDLPPGLEQQLERRGRLPPGLEKRDLPDELEARLGATPDGVERTVVGKDVVLVEQATGVILDILRDVVK